MLLKLYLQNNLMQLLKKMKVMFQKLELVFINFPIGIGLKQVLVINASRSDSYHIFRAPAAPAPIETKRIAIIASFVETTVGAIKSPTAHVKITKDITLGFINLNNSEKLNTSLLT